jgi:hypothetical protein
MQSAVAVHKPSCIHLYYFCAWTLFFMSVVQQKREKNLYILLVCMIILFCVSTHIFCFVIQHCPFPHVVLTQLIMADRLWQLNSNWSVFGYASYSKTLWGKYVNYNWNSWPTLSNRRKGMDIYHFTRNHENLYGM